MEPTGLALLNSEFAVQIGGTGAAVAYNSSPRFLVICYGSARGLGGMEIRRSTISYIHPLDPFYA